MIQLMLYQINYGGFFLFLFLFLFFLRLGFPESSVGKEFACNTGDFGSIPGLGRSAGEGIGYPLQYIWALWLSR